MDPQLDTAQRMAEELAAKLFEQPVTPLAIQLILEYGQQARRDALTEAGKVVQGMIDSNLYGLCDGCLGDVMNKLDRLREGV